jgi:hypothetical protein
LAQDFVVPCNKSKKGFSKAFVTILNEAPSAFKKYKGKLLLNRDSIHKQSEIYECLFKLPSSKQQRYVQDSTYFVEYFFSEYSNLDLALGGMNNLIKAIQTALDNRALLHENKEESGNILRETKIAYMKNSGFFHYNIAVQLTKLIGTNNIRLVLQIFYGKPVYYHIILPNQPRGSFSFINAVQNTFQFFNERKDKICSYDIPPFKCMGIKKSGDSTYLIYQKKGFETVVNANTDFDVTFSNLIAGLGEEYVYWYLPNSTQKSIAFISSYLI